jgi:hypothetical protein
MFPLNGTLCIWNCERRDGDEREFVIMGIKKKSWQGPRMMKI